MCIEVWNDVSEEGKKFLLRMLVKDPVERPKAGELLQDNWIQKHAENGVLDRQHHMEILKNLKNHKVAIYYAYYVCLDSNSATASDNDVHGPQPCSKQGHREAKGSLQKN